MNWRDQNIRLRRLEAEAISIVREVVSEFRNPVMLYSMGKDSSALLHVAQKAFAPGKPPFPLLHVDTTWKFREMIAFRDETAARLGMDLLVHVNQEGLARGISPVASGSAIHTQVMKTEGLRQALDKWHFDAAFGGARRDEEKSRAKERIFSHRSAGHGWDPRNQRPELWRLFNTRIKTGRIDARVPAVQLDRTRRVGIHPRREHSGRAALFRQAAPGGRARRRADHGRRRAAAARARRKAAHAARTLPHARLLSADRRDPLRRRHARRHHRGNARRQRVRNGRAASSITTKLARWKRRSARAISDAAVPRQPPPMPPCARPRSTRVRRCVFSPAARSTTASRR